MSRLHELERKVAKAEGLRDGHLAALTKARKRLEAANSKIETLEAAAELLQAATETRRGELKDRVEVLVTRGIRAVFDRPDYEFAFNVTRQRGFMGVVPVLRSDYHGKRLEASLREGHGGGVCDVVAFVLRVVILSLVRPKMAPILILDESFRNVAAEHLRGVASLLVELNRSAGIQFVLVTHKPELLDAADVIYRARLEEGETKFKLEHDLRDEDYHQAPTRERLRRGKESSVFGQEDLTKPVKAAEGQATGRAGTEQARSRTKRLMRRKNKRKK